MFGRFLIICGISVPLLAGGLFVQKGHYGVTYDVLTLPHNEKMGLLGTSYLYDFGHAYVGLGIYSAVTGHRGGFLPAEWRVDTNFLSLITCLLMLACLLAVAAAVQPLKAAG